MTTYILGSNGRIGRILSRHAKRAGLEWLGQTRSVGGDIQWSGSMDDQASAQMFQPEATIINMIGSTSSDVDELQRINVKFVRDILVRAANAGVAHVMLASSAAVYGKGDGTPFTEDSTLSPLTPYGNSKARMEEVALNVLSAETSTALTILRIGNVAGADALLAAAEQHVQNDTPMPLHRFPNGQAPVRSYIGPQDLFDVVKALAAPPNTSHRTLNVAAPSPISLEAALKAYKMQLLPHLTWTNAPAPEGVPANVTLSTQDLERHMAFQPDQNYSIEMARQVAKDRTT